MAGMRWTEKEIKILKALCKAGKTMPEVQKVFPHRTKNGIHCRASEEGLSLMGLEPEPDFAAFERIMKKGGKQKCL